MNGQEPDSIILWMPEESSAKRDGEAGDVSHWLAFLAYLAYLRSMRPPATSEVRVLRLLIVTVAAVLVAVSLSN